MPGPAISEGRQCLSCGQHKDRAQFDLAADCAGGLRPQCTECRRAYNRETYRRRASGLPGRRAVAPEGSKRCPRCMLTKPVDEFPRNRSAGDGRATYCLPCHSAAGRASKERMGGSRDYHLKRRYGLTSADVDAMVEAQGGQCALCQERDPQHVDHDHRTGAVRGVLCSCCNQGLGNFRDRAQLLRDAVAYLERTTGQPRVVRAEPGVYEVSALT